MFPREESSATRGIVAERIASFGRNRLIARIILAASSTRLIDATAKNAQLAHSHSADRLAQVGIKFVGSILVALLLVASGTYLRLPGDVRLFQFAGDILARHPYRYRIPFRVSEYRFRFAGRGGFARNVLSAPRQAEPASSRPRILERSFQMNGKSCQPGCLASRRVEK